MSYIDTIIKEIRQAIETFAERYPTGSILKLNSAYNFPAWENHLLILLSSEKGGIAKYFESGDLSIPSNITVTVTNSDGTTTS